MANDILLETGTGEVELLEFLIDGNQYGINVLKIKEIVKLDKIVPVPGAAPAIAGKAGLRNNLLTVIDLRIVLKGVKIEAYEKAVGLLCQFNQTQVVFMVEDVIGIKRFGWNELENQDQMGTQELVIGTILKENEITTLLDFESILISLSPKHTFYGQLEQQGTLTTKRNECRIILADDSRMVREMLKDALEGSGYDHLKFFNNGQEVLDFMSYLKEEYGEAARDRIDLVITDIEMPMMDGYTLTRKIKEDEILKDIPVIIFSSLITDELYHKGEQVGAEAQIGKPSLKKLVGLIDDLVGIE